MNEENTQSTFVTVLAWIFIIGSGLFTVMALMQNVIFRIMFSGELMQQVVKDPAIDSNTAFGFNTIFENFQYLFLVFLFISGFTLASSIGLLRRKNWARMFFIIVMGLGIFWNVICMGMFSFFSGLMPTAGVEGFDQFNRAMKVMQAFVIAMAVGFSVLFGWIIYKLRSPQIKREFKPPKIITADEAARE
ncbi:MAG TPA: hypothetical protein PK859_04170 [Spirochaetota bacterium]|nr:hypothetical protein [Spirochaetota bacterium]HPR48845.1 hypothetical protein [Spirochaetota bacterium]